MKTSSNTILITGGSSGIGWALAKRFLQLKNKVIITGRNQAKLQSLKETFPELEIFCCDLTNRNSFDALLLYIEQEHPDTNLLINNAAIQYNYSFLEEPDLAYKTEYEIATNLIAPIKLTGLLLPTLIKNPDPAIINISSGLFISPKKTASVYCATKAALHSYTKTLRYQLEDKGVNVFEIIPPLVETPMTEGRGKAKISPEKLVEEFIRNFKADRFESYIGKSKLLKWLHRLSPALSDTIMKNGI